MFCISSRICSFNSGLLLKTLLLRYSQRKKKSIGDKWVRAKSWPVNVTSFGYPKMSHTEQNVSLEVWHVSPCWFLYGFKCKYLCRMRFKDVLSTFKILDCFRIENPGCSRTDALTRSTFSGSRDVFGRPDSDWFIVEPVYLKFCTHFLINWINGALFLCSML